MTFHARWRASALVVALAVCAAGLYAASARQPNRAQHDHYKGWPAYGGGPEQIRYSSLTQINRSNVHRLKVAWTYDSGETGGLQTNPVVNDGILYTTTPQHRVVALDAATGEVKWTFDSRLDSKSSPAFSDGSRGGPNRGVMYWSDGENARILTAQVHYLYALDARTGQPIREFGRDGRIDLRENLGRDPEQQSIRLTTPGVVYKDLVIVGGRVSESLPGSPGHVRAYDVRHGTLRWTFHTIPHPGEVGYETWPKDAWTYSGGANNWGGMALDADRGIVFVPTGSASADFYGANRVGDNLFANSLIALKADTGERIWHFQVVRHDTWDRDLGSPPSLVSVTHNRRRIDAVALTTKHGYVFLFDRTNGRPLFPIEYRRFPASPVDGEQLAHTQPIPRKPLPFARQSLTHDLLTKRTPEAHRAALEAFRALRSGGQFVPLAVGQETVVFPGFDGGAEWGGSAFDPETALLYVNANEMAWTGALAPSPTGTGGRETYLRECATCHRDDLSGSPPQIPSLFGVLNRRDRDDITRTIREGVGRMPGFPTLSDGALTELVRFVTTGEGNASSQPDISSSTALKYRFTGYKKFLDPDGYPAIAPPWGTLSAINLNTGEYAWKIPLGEYPELSELGMTNTGSENYGGPVVTAGGLVFIGATNFDKKFRALDKTNGTLLWEVVLPFSGNGTPSTYEVNGRQFVVTPAGGGKARGQPSGGTYVAFALEMRETQVP